MMYNDYQFAINRPEKRIRACNGVDMIETAAVVMTALFLSIYHLNKSKKSQKSL